MALLSKAAPAGETRSCANTRPSASAWHGSVPGQRRAWPAGLARRRPAASGGARAAHSRPRAGPSGIQSARPCASSHRATCGAVQVEHGQLRRLGRPVGRSRWRATMKSSRDSAFGRAAAWSADSRQTSILRRSLSLKPRPAPSPRPSYSSASIWCTVSCGGCSNFAHQRQAPVGGNHHLEGPGLPVAPRVLARDGRCRSGGAHA